MKAIKMYKCEHCGTMYNSEQKATECEKYHQTCRKIVRENHKPLGVDTFYPLSIHVEMSDGEIVSYKRMKIVR